MVVTGLLLSRALSVVPMNETDLNQQEKDPLTHVIQCGLGVGATWVVGYKGHCLGPMTRG